MSKYADAIKEHRAARTAHSCVEKRLAKSEREHVCLGDSCHVYFDYRNDYVEITRVPSQGVRLGSKAAKSLHDALNDQFGGAKETPEAISEDEINDAEAWKWMERGYVVELVSNDGGVLGREYRIERGTLEFTSPVSNDWERSGGRKYNFDNNKFRVLPKQPPAPPPRRPRPVGGRGAVRDGSQAVRANKHMCSAT